LTTAQEVLCWAVLCFSPQGVDFYDPIHAQQCRLASHYHNSGFGITYGLDVHLTGATSAEWLVVKYEHDVFAPLKPKTRSVSWHWPDGGYKELVK
jgi:hypothetical protein